MREMEQMEEGDFEGIDCEENQILWETERVPILLVFMDVYFIVVASMYDVNLVIMR